VDSRLEFRSAFMAILWDRSGNLQLAVPARFPIFIVRYIGVDSNERIALGPGVTQPQVSNLADA